MKTTTQIVNDYMSQTKSDLIQSYRDKGLKASGGAENLTVNVVSSGDGVRGTIAAPIQWWFMQNGRKPNKNATTGQIYFLKEILDKWQEDKGITINTWLAAKKIVTKGITVPNRYNPGGVISDVVNSEWLNKLGDQLQAAKIEEFNTIIRQWQ